MARWYKPGGPFGVATLASEAVAFFLRDARPATARRKSRAATAVGAKRRRTKS
jgi:hypothetical protein